MFAKKDNIEHLLGQIGYIIRENILDKGAIGVDAQGDFSSSQLQFDI